MAFIAVLLGALACLVAGAQAQVITDPVTHKHFGIVPVASSGASSTPGRSSKLKADCSTDCSPLLYGGGPVQHAQHDYLFFWDPNGSLPAPYKTGLAQWLDDLAGASADTTPISVTQQYYDNSGPSSAQNFVRFAVQHAGSITDTNPYPANGCTPGAGYSSCLTDGQLEAELTSYISAHNLPTGTDVEYFILTPQGVDTCTDSSSSECASNVFCGYHSTYQLPGSGQSVIYADLPWVYGVSGCTGGAPLNSGFIDPVVGVFSHELSESMTDPNAANGWIDSAGNEIGDKCVGVYGDNLPTLNGAQYNVQLGADHYLIQTEFSNRTLNCELNMPIPVNSALPAISGQARQASLLTESNGTWTGAPTSYTYQWEACDAQGANCSPLSGATGQTYQPAPGDVGHTIRVTEVAVNPAGSSAAALQHPPPSYCRCHRRPRSSRR